jgi:DNA-binding response OmpR family regulator
MESAGDRATVLIVEDDLDVLIAERDALERAGYAVLTAINGNSAVLITERSPPDVVVIDLCVADLDGEALCNALRKRLGYLPPIVAISTRGHLESTEAALDDPFVLTAPVDATALVATVAMALHDGTRISRTRLLSRPPAAG